ncbi:MAG: prolyl oligopeptidase family serine peptidase [Ilumatobacteraceae bacterium]
MSDAVSTPTSDTFPRQYARTQRLSLGEPRNITVSPNGQRVVFCRSNGGNDPVNCLWVLDTATGNEQLVADPLVLLSGAGESDLPIEERRRRERAREGAGGVVSYATNPEVTVAAFTLGGRLFTAGLLTAQSRELSVVGPVFDPRPDPTASRVAYCSGGSLRIAELDGSSREVVAPDAPTVTWGLAEFIAAEEMGRGRGYWWSPDGEALAVARVDTAPVHRWFISNPAAPEIAPQEVAYPAAGTPNADVTLHIVSLSGLRAEVVWDNVAFPYLVDVSWFDRSSVLVTVQSRDQRDVRVLLHHVATGDTNIVSSDHDDHWVEIVRGVPASLADGRIVSCSDLDGVRRLLVDGRPETPTDLQERSIVAVGITNVTFCANPVDEPTVQHVFRWTTVSGVEQLTEGTGVHTGVAGGSTVVIRSSTPDQPRATFCVLSGPPIASHSEEPLVRPNVTMLRLGDRRLATALLLPPGRLPGDGGPLLPVLMDPYGGPHAQRVLSSYTAMCSPQWFADQGFAVVVVDGAGTPGRGSAWEREVAGDLAAPVLDDQVSALRLASEHAGILDLTRVGIRGWSFGGYLAALAVLRRPDVFHAAIAGAPVTEWRLYDTHYTERYLGDPGNDAGAYDRSSLLPEAADLQRPLLLIHGLADDNVVAAHTLQLSSALLAAGRPHEVLPLVGVSHMTPQEVGAENLLLLQLEFLRRHLRA